MSLEEGRGFASSNDEIPDPKNQFKVEDSKVNSGGQALRDCVGKTPVFLLLWILARTYMYVRSTVVVPGQGEDFFAAVVIMIVVAFKKRRKKQFNLKTNVLTIKVNLKEGRALSLSLSSSSSLCTR